MKETIDIVTATGLSKAQIVEKIQIFDDLDTDSKELIEAAVAARQYAYCPYSNFKVGAAFRTKCGRIFSGCNIESSSFTPTSCAERTAISKAVSEGFMEFVSGSVVAFQENSITTPCGVCRQFLMEFASQDFPMYITRDRNGGGKVYGSEQVLCTSVYNLLPNGFRAYN